MQDQPEETMNTICSHVASGGSLIDLCDMWHVVYGDMVSWIRADRERSRRYVDAQNDRAEWGKERFLVELKNISFSDVVSKLYDEEGQIKPIKDWPKDVSALVKSIEHDDDGKVKKVHFFSKEKGLEMLGKKLGEFLTKVEHSGKMTLEELITASRGDEDEQ